MLVSQEGIMTIDSPDFATARTDTRLFVPVTWQHEGKVKEAAIAMEAVLKAMLSLPYLHPITYVISAGAGEPTTAGFEVSGFDASSTAAGVNTFSRVYEGYNCWTCLLYTSPSPRDATLSRMPSSA